MRTRSGRIEQKRIEDRNSGEMKGRMRAGREIEKKIERLNSKSLFPEPHILPHWEHLYWERSPSLN